MILDLYKLMSLVKTYKFYEEMWTKASLYLFWGENKVEICSMKVAFRPPLWKDIDFRCVNAISKVATRGLLLLDTSVDVGMIVVFSCMSSL